MASADYSVLTPERVSVQYDIAGVGSRGAAVFIDTLLQSTVLVLVVLGTLGGAAATSILTDDASEVFIIVVLVIGLFLITLGYFMVFEIVWSGQTPGKRIVGVRVLRENGYPVRPVDAVIRNLVRLVDWLPVGYAVGLLSMLCNARSKRLGDFAAGTIVVREGARLSSAVGPYRARVSGSEAKDGPRLSGADATLVRDFLVRRGGLEADARQALATRLALALGERYGLAVEGDPEVFLERLDA